MAKDFDESNGKPLKYVKDRDKEQGASWQESNTSNKWGSYGQRSEVRGYMPRTARSTGNLNDNNQDNQCTLAGSSSTSGFENNPDMGCTPMIDFTAVRQANLDRKCQKKLFEGTEEGTQSRNPNPKRFVCPNQIRNINRILRSDSDNIPFQKNSYPENSSAGDSSLCRTREKSSTPISDSDKTPVQKNSYLGNSSYGDSSLRRTRQKSVTPISDSDRTLVQKNSYPGNSSYGDSSLRITREKSVSLISESEKTPTLKNSYSENSDGDSSLSTARDKSFTPTLTDLENSVHYDCRLDKVLRVALDYALPGELKAVGLFGSRTGKLAWRRQ